MTKNFTDVIEAMAIVKENGQTVDSIVLTDKTVGSLMTDEKLSTESKDTHDSLGEYSVTIESGDDNYVLTESGDRFEL